MCGGSEANFWVGSRFLPLSLEDNCFCFCLFYGLLFLNGACQTLSTIERPCRLIEQPLSKKYESRDSETYVVTESNFCVCILVFSIVLQACSLAPVCNIASAIAVPKQHSALQSHCALGASLHTSFVRWLSGIVQWTCIAELIWTAKPGTSKILGEPSKRFYALTPNSVLVAYFPFLSHREGSYSLA